MDSRTYKKGSRKTGCPFLPRTVTLSASLRGLLERTYQRFEHLLVLLLGGLVVPHVFFLRQLGPAPVAVERVALAAQFGGVERLILFPLRFEPVDAEIGDEDLRVRHRRAVQVDIHVAVL